VTADSHARQFVVSSSAPDPSRDLKTQAQYRKRYSLLRRQCETQTDTHASSHVAYVNWLIGRRCELKASAFRLYRSASIFAMCEYAQGTTEAPIERVDRLEALSILQGSRGGAVAESEQGDVQYAGPKRTSGKKAKKVDLLEWNRLIESLNLSKSQYAEPICLLLRAGLYSGLRPCEWKHAALQYDIEAGAGTLTVVNGKCSNGRSHGATRTLLWKERGREFEAVEKWIAYLERTLPKNAVDRDTEWDRLYKAWGRQLHSVAERLWPRRERRICFYTARHMFAAEAKKKFSRIEVATLLGHATDATATMHYARPTRSGKGNVLFALPEPDPTEGTRVRQVFEAREAKANFNVTRDENCVEAIRPSILLLLPR
jgi:integrase